ncbi:hypothetical protein ACIQ7Q_15365 [Streptomyces sp. NPDC096176]|uniref:hypothetical protein n=1 Tax=Streptomyces sp. NPDC096176 TaxID=3366079 RepID=UPI0038154D75
MDSDGLVGLDVPDDAGERFTACGDPQLMRTWLSRAVTATSAEAIFTGPME